MITVPTGSLSVRRSAGAVASIEVTRPDSVPQWAAQHRAALRTAVAEHGALRVRGLGLRDATEVTAAFTALGEQLMSDEEAFAQRHRYADGVYSSATWPEHQPMCMHHELSYRLQVPALALFACLTAPTSGGATGVADAGDVLDALPADLVQRFATQGWMLLRSYGGDIGPGLVDAFGTDDRATVEAYCRDNAIDVDWQPDGSLRTRQRRPAVITHPTSGRRVWVNQVAFLSEWTIEPEIREFLVDVYGPEGLPFTTAFGDGSPIDAEVIEELNAVYDRLTVAEPWTAGDLLLVDNLATAHSREPYTGEREVLVGLSDPTRLSPAASR